MKKRLKLTLHRETLAHLTSAHLRAAGGDPCTCSCCETECNCPVSGYTCNWTCTAWTDNGEMTCTCP